MVTIKNDTIRSHVQMKSLSDSLKVNLQLITNANFYVFFVTQKNMISFVLHQAVLLSRVFFWFVESRISFYKFCTYHIMKIFDVKIMLQFLFNHFSSLDKLQPAHHVRGSLSRFRHIPYDLFPAEFWSVIESIFLEKI